MDRILAWWRKHRPTKRRMTQLYAAVLYNANLGGFASGRLYTGPLKSLCVPGLNCYSCPGAVASCPLGALQNAMAAGRGPIFYVTGLLLLFGLTLGRVICGWACPFGLVQELLDRIPVPKLRKSRLTRRLSLTKYGVLAVLVLALPLTHAARREAFPAFCKFLCPAGTLEGAMPLLAGAEGAPLWRMLGGLFTAKFMLMAAILTACVFMHRFFCRFLCPLGALYSLLARVALIGVRVEGTRCSGCGACVRVCPMDVRTPGDRECIHCGKCQTVCPEKAIQWRAGRFVLHGGGMTDAPSGKH